jgi:hypothetical protein
MIWPFRRKTSGSNDLPVPGHWTVAVGENEQDGSVTIARLNNAYLESGSVPGYEHQVGVAVPFHAPETTGLPSAEENVDLTAIEDVICPTIQAEAQSLLVAIVTTGGMREFVFYTRTPQEVQKQFERLRERITSHEIQLMIQRDKDWGVYAQLKTYPESRVHPR